jgi:NTE family protein
LIDGALAMLVHATGMMASQRFVAEIAAPHASAEVIVLPPPCPLDVQPMDFGHADELMSRAEADARAFLSGRDATVVPLRRGPQRHRMPAAARAELPPAG